MNAFAEALGTFGSTVFKWSAVVFLLANGLALAGVLVTRNRELVNRWTPRLVALDLLLVGAGLGVPAVTYCMKAVVSIVSTATPTADVRLPE